ncbi:MAG: VWA domain-containing protein [Myxococcales bacterium]|nr:VWA domain-containing protein [Myxococcales bacterium]
MTKRTAPTHPAHTPNAPSAAQSRRNWRWRSLAAAGTLAIAGLAVAGLPSCDSTAKFSLPDRKFNDVQMVTAFPAHIADDGSIVRVCGAPLDDQPAKVINGVEFNLNFVSTELKSPLCEGDRDQGIKEGELIELYRVNTQGNNPTVGKNNFDLTFDCISPRSDAAGTCSTDMKFGPVQASAVNYVALAPRCDPKTESSRLNVALLMDHSGSVSGFVDKDSFKEDNPAKRSPPNPLQPSDKSNSRIQAAEFFVETLNSRDRLIGYYFNEKINVQVAADDNITCVGGSKNGKKCVSDAQCGTDSDGCFFGGADDGDSFDVMSLGDQQEKAFGSNAGSRKYLLAALDKKVKYNGEGRSNLWDAIDTSYAHLKAQKTVTGPRHIIVLTDGPETCTDGEDFVYKGSDNKCRTPCVIAQQSFSALRKRMHDDEFPVILHFVQFQSKGNKLPDGKMQELACRTGGTYQFINTQEMNLSDAQLISGALNRAMIRVRYTLSGSWRVGLKMNQMTKPSITKLGTMFAGAGTIKFANKRFPSLDTVYATQTSWKFGFESGNEDRRVLFRKGCTTSADCGGSDACGANHCTVDGICVSTNAPDRLPCGPEGSAQVCCQGTCSKDCASACN